MATIFEKVNDQEFSTDAQIEFVLEVKATVLPLLKKLKTASDEPFKTTFLIYILENNLQHLVASYGRETSLVAAYQQLTPAEVLVASMLRQCPSNKVIAASLNVTPATVSRHCTNIRKKLGLDRKTINLQSYLQSLT
jgi:DNA-binding CsgD family transcriptional regulator